MERIFQLLTVIGCVAVCLGVVRIYIHIDCFKLFVGTMNNENQQKQNVRNQIVS